MTSKYIVFNAHHIGASHINKGVQCEDYSESYIDDHMAIAVISDGHGDKNCFRSALGAEIACNVSIEVLSNTLNKEGALSELISSPDRVICEIEKSIIFHWNSRIKQDIIDNPFSETDLEGLDESVVTAIRAGNRLTKIYGCTLIAAVILDGFWFAIHVGDGKCVCVHRNGLYSQPVPWDDEGCVGNRSTSLCDTKAFEKFRYVYGTDVPVAVFVGSDGVDESFDDNGINKCYYSLSSWIKNLSKDEYNAKADELLEKISHGGSGDDVSIGCIISKNYEVKKPFSTSKQVADKMEELYTTLTGAEERFSELNDRKAKLDIDIDSLKGAIEDLEAELEKKKEQLDDKVQENRNVENNLKSMKDQLKPIIKQFQEAKVIKRQVDDYWTNLGVDIFDNDMVMNYDPPMDIADDSEAIIENNETDKQIIKITESNQGNDENEVIKEESISEVFDYEAESILPNKSSPHFEKTESEISEKRAGLISGLFRKK